MTITPVMPTYARSPLAFERGEGAWLITTDGKRYLDFASGVAVNALGHAHPRLVAALQEQAGKLWHTSNLYTVPGQEKVARKLIDSSFAETVFFCNSGAEAMEGCIKLARKYQFESGHPERTRIITASGGFHGRTLGTLAAAGKEAHMRGFAPHLDGFDHVPFGNSNELRNAVTAETAAVLVEPVQGEGGINTADAAYFKALRQTCDEFGLLLIFDEVQCGVARTGHLFAHQAYGVAPDVMGLAKGLGGGFPVGAILATEKAAVGMTPGTHGSTFGGNPLAMAVAEAVLDEVEKPAFLARVNEVSAHLRHGLEECRRQFPQVIAEVRGSGLMLGMKMEPPAADVGKALQEAGLLTVGAADNVVRLLPPLIISKDEADLALNMIKQACTSLDAGK